MSSEVAKTDARAEFNGWRVSAVLGAITLVLGLLVIPHPVTPDLPPLPSLAFGDGARLVEQQWVEARDVGKPLPYAVRALGQAVRDYGRLEARGAADEESLRLVRRVTREAASDAGGRALLALRAIQAQLFVAAALSPPDDQSRIDLDELGGGIRLPADLRQRPTALAVPELSALYRIRWSELTGLQDARAFEPTAVEQLLAARLQLISPRALYGAHPTRAHLAAARRVAELQPQYPLALAEGIILHAHGDYSGAFLRYRSHLQDAEDGPWTLLVRNYAADAAQHITTPY